MPATTIDLTAPATGTDPAGLENYLLQLLGQPVAFARTSYGDEVVLHLGAVRDRPLGKFGPKPFGEIQVGFRGSRWVRRGAGSVTAPAAGAVPPDLVAPGVRVTDARPFPAKYGHGLEIEFGDGDAVVVIPTPPEPGDAADVADWDVLTPAGLLTAGPGPTWTWAPAGGG